MLQNNSNQPTQPNNHSFTNFDSMENIPASMQTQMFKQRRLDMCDRVFESIVYDMKLLIKQFDSESVNSDIFLKELERIVAQLKLFSSKGEVRSIIARATTVIIDKVTNDITEDDVTSSDDEEIMHC